MTSSADPWNTTSTKPGFEKTALERVLTEEADEMAMNPLTPSIPACNPTTPEDGDPHELLFSTSELSEDDDDDDEQDQIEDLVISDEADE